TNVSVSDSDTTNMASALITLTNAKGGDSLAVSDTAALAALGIAVDPSSTATSILLTGSASQANYQSALKLILVNHTSSNPDTTPRDVTVTVNDGFVDSNIAHTTIAVTAVNDPPSLDLDVNTPGNDFATSFTEGGPATPIAPTVAVITDPDSPNMTRAT